MKVTSLLLGFICFATLLKAQVHFEEFKTLDELFRKAKKEKKLVFIQIESAECTECNQVAMIGLGSSQLLEKFQLNFVSTKVSQSDDLYRSMLQTLNIEKAVGSIFMTADGEFLSNQNSTASNAIFYLDIADKAKEYAVKLSSINELKKEYEKGNKSSAFLEKYILALREIHRFDAQLMDEYIGKMIVDSLQSDKIIRFVSEHGQPLSSQAYKLIRAANSQKKIDSVWYLIDNADRVHANNRTRTKTFEIAVKTKNENLMYQLSHFTRNIYGKDWRRAGLQSAQIEVDYYRAIKDTMNYLKRANNLAQYQYYPATNDSLKAWDVQERERVIAERTRERRFILVSDEYAGALNNIAWNFYLMSNDTSYLSKGLVWVKRAMEIREKVSTSPEPESPQFMDTYAHLLYKLKRYEEAVIWQSKAVEVNKKSTVKIPTLQVELDKMKERRL